MRVLVVLNYYSPYVSGLSEHARRIAEGLVRSGCTVTVLTGRHDPNLPVEEFRGGVRVLRSEPLFFLHKGYISTRLVELFQELCSGVDLIHLRLPMLEAGLLAILTPSRKPLVVSYHCDVTRQRRGSLVDWAAVAAVRASARLCLRRADRITVSTRDYANGSPVLRGTSHKWTEVYPPDDAGRSLGPGTRDGFKRIGFLGRFAAEKGIDVLLEAVPVVLQKVPAARFILAGNHSSVAGGSEYARLRSTIESLGAALMVPGEIPADDVPAFYRSLDVFVLPSIDSYEAFGVVQVEAMKAGVPVIATQLRGVRMPVTLTGNGVLVPAGDAAALAAAIVEVLSAPGRFHRERVAESAWRVFPAGQPVAQTLACYEAALPQREGAR